MLIKENSNKSVNLENSKILIYGATGGIGTALCQAFYQKQAQLWLIGRKKEKLEKLAERFNLPQDRIYCTEALTEEKGYQEAQTWIRQSVPQIDVGIHAIGKGLFQSIEKLTLTEWKSLFDLHVHSAFAFSKLVRKHRNPKHWQLVFFGSASTNQVWPKNAIYGASKAALDYFTQVLQKEIRQEKGRVWHYRAGSINTNFFNQVKNHLPKEKMIQPDQLARIVLENLQLPSQIYSPSLTLLSE